ncbi:MAG: GNAT family N-acetyltransferase, partial [Chloroflexota bacterium]
LVSVAGVHVYSEAYKVAALGGITTHPHYRGKRYAQRTIARLCRELSKTVDHIGLNVLGRNDTAVKVYQKLGFDKSNEYIEVMLTRK